MKKILIYILIVFLLSTFISCSDIEKDSIPEEIVVEEEIIQPPVEKENTIPPNKTEETSDVPIILPEEPEDIPATIYILRQEPMSRKKYFSYERELSDYTKGIFQEVILNGELRYSFNDDMTKIIMTDMKEETETIVFEASTGATINEKEMLVCSYFLVFVVDDTIYRLYLQTGEVDLWVKDSEIREIIEINKENPSSIITNSYEDREALINNIGHIVVVSNTDIVWHVPPKEIGENEGYGYYRAYSRITNRKYLIDGRILSYEFSRTDILTCGYLKKRAKDMETIGYDPISIVKYAYHRTPVYDSSDLTENMNEWYKFMEDYDSTLLNSKYSPSSSICANDFVIYSENKEVIQQAVPYELTDRNQKRKYIYLQEVKDGVTWREIKIGDDVREALEKIPFTKEAVYVLGGGLDVWAPNYYIPYDPNILNKLINVRIFDLDVETGIEKDMGIYNALFVMMYLDENYHPVNYIDLYWDIYSDVYQLDGIHITHRDDKYRSIYNYKMEISLQINNWVDSNHTDLTNKLMVYNYSASFNNLEDSYRFMYQMR